MHIDKDSSHYTSVIFINELILIEIHIFNAGSCVLAYAEIKVLVLVA